MANEEHLDLLKQGIKVWNTWRKEHRDVCPDLRRANLSETDLRRANLSGADLRRAVLRSSKLGIANLKNANLRGAILNRADLDKAYLSNADLSLAKLHSSNLMGADLRKANLFGASLIRANLEGADLREADLSYSRLDFANLSYAGLSHAKLINASCRHTYLNLTYLVGADLSQTSMAWAILVDIDLRSVKGLEKVNHISPSSIGIDTIYRSQGNIPEVFLRGAGLDDTFIAYIRSLVGKPIEYYSCFISYSSKDQEFAERIYADLQNKNIRCWFAQEDMKIGDRIRDRIEQSVHLYEKLLLVLSEHSVMSEWVEDEVEAALERERLARERGEERTVLFPVRLDDIVKTTTKAWAAKLRRQRHIGDFSSWKNHDEYQESFNRLLRDLKRETQ
jgi:uncharacterized protein YjbI with pentapeptide repeats